MVKMKKIFITILIYNSLAPTSFFKPSYFWSESLWGAEKSWSDKGATFKIKHGKTATGRDKYGNKKNVLSIYGNENLHAIAKGVPQETLDKLPTSILDLLHLEARLQGQGDLQVNGKLNITEINVEFFAGLSKHWHANFEVNFEKIKFNKLTYKDLTPTDSIPASIGVTAWNDFFDNFAENMKAYGITIPNNSVSGLAKEIEFLAGYTNQIKNTKFGKLDLSATAGMAIPFEEGFITLVSLGHGYGDSINFSLSGSGTVTPREGFAFGLSGGVIQLLSKTLKEARMKTALEQSGLLKLAQGETKVSYGIFGSVGFHSVWKIKENWTLAWAYKYNTQASTKLKPTNTDIFNEDVVNSDPPLASWYMNVLNLFFEYEKEWNNKTISAAITIDLPLGGKYIFDTKMFGTGASIAFKW
jgi:hypothetical protein